MALADYEGCASAAACLRAARRRKQLLAKQATAGKLAKAYDRIVELEAEVAALRAAQVTTGVADMSTSSTSPVQIAAGPAAIEELQARLALIAPVVLQGIYTAREQRGIWSHKLSSLVVARCNAAAHCFYITASAISNMSQRALNAVQRGKRMVKIPDRGAYRQSLPLARLAFIVAWGTGIHWPVAAGHATHACECERGQSNRCGPSPAWEVMSVCGAGWQPIRAEPSVGGHVGVPKCLLGPVPLHARGCDDAEVLADARSVQQPSACVRGAVERLIPGVRQRRGWFH